MTSCSVEWDAAELPAWGTAKEAHTIIVVEAAGAWGRDAVSEAGFRAPQGATLYVIRRVGRHAETPGERHVFVSGGFDREPWLVGGLLSEAALCEFLSGDVVDIARQDRFGLRSRDEPVLLVCTNGKRDECCAVRGRPVALAGHATAPGSVWEVSHIGGHKLAPTAIHLPSGQTFGRLDASDASTLAAAEISGTLPPELFSRTKHRGRVDLPPAEQVAETWWREQRAELSLAPITMGRMQKTDVGVAVGLPDGSSLLVTSHRGPELRDSCVKAPKPTPYFDASLIG